jgi:hypothetical protein
MNETEVRHVTKAGPNLFRELGFSSAEATHLQVESREQISPGTAGAEAGASKRASRLAAGMQMWGEACPNPTRIDLATFSLRID